jgi:hypothetical protein
LPFLGGAGIHRTTCVIGLRAPAKINDLIRKAEAKSREALARAMGQAISAVGARGEWGLFEHCGYRAVVQPF